MSRVARLLAPALRWNDEAGFGHERESIETALSLGVGGFVLFGGESAAVRSLTAELRQRSSVPLLIAADLERGAGQQFRGATQLPPLAALGYLDDLHATRKAAALTAREALALGVDWVLAPVADLDIEPDNPIVGTRSFGADPTRVAAHVTAWIEGCRDEGARCCAKHFPGHGRTVDDSHERRPVVPATRKQLDLDLTPFRAAILAGADGIMTAHVAYPALDPTGLPATASPAIVRGLLRDELEFGGLVMTDALIMRSILEDGAAQAMTGPVGAGCDVLLYPPDATAAESALAAAVGTQLDETAVRDAVGRIEAAAAGPRPTGSGIERKTDPGWALGVAQRTIHIARGSVEVPHEFDMLSVDDDVGGPYPPPSRDPFVRALREAGFDPRPVERVEGQRPAVVAAYADIRAWKGRPGLSSAAQEAIEAAVDRRPDTVVILFAHARLAAAAPGRNIVVAWGGERVMQEAAARWLASESTPPTAA
jgi:beta-glucosidase-like glycosyl hydrolase